MNVPRKQAERICTEAEFDLVKSSYSTGARAPHPQRLKEKVKLVRKLRDKYRDIARRQRREVRRAGLSTGEIPEPPPSPPPVSRLQQLLEERRLARMRPEPEPRRFPVKPPKPKRVVGDDAADLASRKAEVFAQALERMETELRTKEGM
jgi:hypothetical protein